MPPKTEIMSPVLRNIADFSAAVANAKGDKTLITEEFLTLKVLQPGTRIGGQ